MRYVIQIILLIFLMLFANLTPLYAENGQISSTAIGNGIGIGSALAVAICWSRTHSVLTSSIAGLFGWLYVIYFVIVRESD